MRILSYLPSIDLSDGGVVRAVIDLYAELSDAGIQCRLLAGQIKDRAAVDPNIELVEIDDRLLSSVLYRLGLSKKHAAASHIYWCDCVHLHQAWSIQNMAISRVATEIGKPIALSPHGMLDEWSLSQKSLKKNTFLKLSSSYMMSEVSTIHCTAHGEMEQVRKRLPRPVEDFTVIPLFDRSFVENSQNKLFKKRMDGAFKVLFLSRVHPKKGIEFLIDAVAILVVRNHRIELTVAGPGDESYVNELKRRASDRGIENSLSFTGMVEGQAKWELYSQSDVFVLPTYQENFGLVLVEAMMSGVPTITTKGTDIWPELESANAFIVDQTPEAIADAIQQVCLSSAADKYVPDVGKLKNWLEPSALRESYAKMYRSLIDP